MNELTTKEKKEPMQISIGRLRVRIRDYGNDKRALALLEKIEKEASKLERENAK